MFNGFFVQALNQSFDRFFPGWLRLPIVASGPVYGDHGRMYLMGAMSEAYEPHR